MAKKAAKSRAQRPRRSNPPARTWSARSQASMEKQFKLEGTLTFLNSLVAAEERKMREAQNNRDRQLRLVSEGQGVYRSNLHESIAQIETSKQLIAAYKERASDTRAEIAALQLTPEQAAERAGTQAEMARLATKCQDEIAALDAEVEAVKEHVKAIIRLKRELGVLGEKIEFKSGDGYGSRPFEEVFFKLPDELRHEGAQWLAWFLGTNETRECSIRGDNVFPETLSSAHAYRSGDVAHLNERDFAAATYEPPYVPDPIEMERLAQQKAIENHGQDTFSINDPRFQPAGMTP